MKSDGGIAMESRKETWQDIALLAVGLLCLLPLFGMLLRSLIDLVPAR